MLIVVLKDMFIVLCVSLPLYLTSLPSLRSPTFFTSTRSPTIPLYYSPHSVLTSPLPKEPLFHLTIRFLVSCSSPSLLFLQMDFEYWHEQGVPFPNGRENIQRNLSAIIFASFLSKHTFEFALLIIRSHVVNMHVKTG